MIQFAVQAYRDRCRAIAKVKNNLYYAFGYNVFLIKGMSGIHLPYTVNGLLKKRFNRYVMIVLQIAGNRIKKRVLRQAMGYTF